MNQEGKSFKRKSWIAAIMGMSMPGMGQIYNRELLKGMSIFVIFMALIATGFRLSVYLPDRLVIVGVTLTLAIVVTVYVFSIIEAYRKHYKQEGEYILKPYNRWYFYIAVWMLGSVLITGFVYNYTRDNIIHVYKIATKGMEPAILRGDRVLVDKTAYRRMPPKRGDIIIFVYPDDRSKVYIRRIAGLPGDMIKLEGGREVIVPHGAVYVLGDNKQNSEDSSKFGFIPLKDVVGKARQVWYSYGVDGMRWSRVGHTFG
ncbi:MAG: signal peptidase I [Nitrospirae bacterium]|uniref:signal peptidase I n=1 Tax=Candidatus Wunengus sp. YC65 TaxID=3367701 RepID=UPI001EB47D82|nr:signal peptidase I [Nitrospirota bacterium]